MVAVDEVYIFSVHVLQERGRIHRSNPVPAHVRDLVRRHDFLHLALKEPQALYAGTFFTAFKQQLFTQADAQEGFAACQGFLDSFLQTPGPHGFHTVAKGTHPGQDHPGSVLDHLGIRRNQGIGPDLQQPIIHRVQIAPAIIDDDDGILIHITVLPCCSSPRAPGDPWPQPGSWPGPRP